MYITPAATSLPPPASIFQEAERLRFDSLELDHLEKLEAERLGRNLSRMRFAEQLLGEHGHGTLADALLTMRNKCTDLGSDPGSDSGIRALLWSLKTDPQHASYAAKIGTVYSSISDMVCQQAWSRFLKCWEVWSNVASLHDHRLVSIGISRRPDIAMVPYKRALDELRDRVVARVRPYANWYSWQLDISVAKNNRHPHYHLLCIIPSDLAEAFYDDIGDLRFGVFRGGEGLMDVGHCDWQEGDRRRKPLDLADRQEAWIMALAYVTRVFTERDMPRWTCAPTLSCPLEVEDYRDQIGRAWDQALPRIFEVNSEQKALGARRIALLLKDDTRRRVISFRQSKAWRATPTAQAPVHKAAGATVSPVVSDISHFPLTPIQAAPHETPCGAAYLSLLDELGSSPEHGSLDFAQELERNLEHGGGADDGSFPSRVVKKGIKQQRGGRPRKTFSQQAVLVALCERGSVVAAAKALGTSRRLISEVLQDAGVASPPRGRPRRDRQAVR